MSSPIEPLENRSFFSSVTFTNGVLAITGNDTRDVISVDLKNDRVVATVNGVASQKFVHVDSITVDARGGNDLAAINVDVGSKLRGGAGNDELYGGGRDDRLDGGAGSDFLSGRGGRDVADYASRTANLEVDIYYGGYNDGEAGEKDNVRGDVEGIAAGSGDDDLFGWIYADNISAGAGNDTIEGDDGDDTLNGDDGDDVIYGGGDDDRLSGGDDDDFLDSGGGRNLMYGNDGDDDFDARNGRADDAVDGGRGQDFAKIDYEPGVGNDDDRDNSTSVEHRHYYWID